MAVKTFYHWAKANHMGEENPHGDFVMDMTDDKDFPWFHSMVPSKLFEYYSNVERYLRNRGACDEAVEAFKELYGMYLVNYCAEQFEEKRSKKMSKKFQREGLW